MADAFDPARRLYEILKQSAAQDATQSARVVWAHLLGLSPDDRPAIFRALTQLTELVNEIETAISGRTDVDAKLLLEKLPAIRKAIGLMQLEGNWTTHARMLSEVAVRDLLFCSNELQRFQPEEKLEDEVLAELGRNVDSLFNDVAKASIDAELRRVLLVCLESFRRALVDYRIRGATGLRDAATKTIGELLLVSDKVDAQTRPLIRRVWGVARKSVELTATAVKFKELADSVHRLALQLFETTPPPQL
jgi:hypothetical protein